MVDITANVKFPDGEKVIVEPVREKDLSNISKNSKYLVVEHGSEAYDLTKEAIKNKEEVLIREDENEWVLFSSLVTDSKIFMEFIPYVR